MRVGLFITCTNDAMYPQTGRATVAILERLGVEVDFPAAQSCCGQMHFNSGFRRQTLPMVRNFARTFAEYDYVVTPSGSCAAMIVDEHPLIAEQHGDAALRHDVAAIVPRVKELSQLLIDVLGVDDVGAWFPHQVTFHPACHGMRFLGVRDRQMRLLRNVEDLDLVELPGAEQCCGFGGTFSLKNPATSAAMVADKCTNVIATGAEAVTSGDNACLLNIDGALLRRGAGVRALHYAEILASTRTSPLLWESVR
jgi:L-lactate dehydrogenase complex protein LldE